jgi:hypothetical protein
MRPRLVSLALALAAALAPASALAARRTTVLLIPVDRNAGSAATRFTEYLETAVGKRSGYSLKEAAAALGDSTPTAALEARKRVIGSLNEGKKFFAGGQFDEAESALRTALVDVDNASAAMERCGEYCDTLAYLAGAQLMKGDEQGARDVLKTLLGIERGYKFDSAVFGKNMIVLVKDVQKAQAHEALVSLTIQTTPPGGRAYLDGQYKGYAPLTVERVAAGRHMLRVERAGSVTYGQLIEVGTTEEGTVKAKLNSTPEYSALENSLDKVAEEIEKNSETSNELMRLGGKLKVDRAIVGLVRSGESRITLDCVLVDFAARKKLSRKTRTFEGEEYGELQKEVERFGNLLMAEADGPKEKVKDSSDPLDRRSGTEDWDEEGSGGSGSSEDKPKPKEKDKPKKKGNEETGTGEW